MAQGTIQGSGGGKAKRPNILWISFEDTNPFYGCYGDKVARTPNVDKLAAGGRIYPKAFSTAGVCAPARSAVITGMYPTAIGTMHMRTAHTNTHAPELPTPYSAVVPHYVKCFTEYLRAEGYYCTNNVKTDYQFEPPVSAWDELSTEAHWRNRPDQDQPFFAVFNPTVTHESGMWPFKCPEPTFDPKDMQLPPYFPDTFKVREAMARMYTNIETADQYMGKLLTQLEEDGLADNTIVFHWSDHGPLPRGKRWPYDSGIHIPMIVRWPGHIPAGDISDRLVSTVDLGPTVLSLADIPIPQHLQGKAFLGKQEMEPREYIFAARDRYDESYDMIRAARDTRFKYMRHYRQDQPYLQWIPYRNRHPILQEMWRLYISAELEGDQLAMFRDRPAEELYDTETDPWELNNLAGDLAYKEHLQRLRGAMDEWIAEVGDMGRIPESEMVERWYPGGKQPATASPQIIPLGQGDDTADGVMPATGGGTFKGPVLLQFYCATQGASMVYTIEKTPEDGAPMPPHMRGRGEPRWLLYSRPLRLEPGSYLLQAKAIRIGYQESQLVQARFVVP